LKRWTIASNHYDGLLGLKLGEKQKTDLVEYLKSL
jgi:hypothetical protein